MKKLSERAYRPSDYIPTWRTGEIGEAYGKMNEMRRGREAEEIAWDRRG